MNNILIVVIAVVGTAAGIAANQYFSEEKSLELSSNSAKSVPTKKPATSKTNFRPNYSLKDLEGNTRSAKEWDGKVVIVNFWAEWCPPCRREMPAFIDFQDAYEKKGVTLIGIALDEKNAVVDFTDPMGINYPILIAQEEGIQLSQDYGNRLNVLPFTAIVDRKGNIVKRFAREISFEDLESAVKPLL